MKNKRLLRFLILFDIVILVLLLPLLLLNKEKIDLNEDIRSFSGNDFVELSHGFVHYDLSGSTEGDLVVLVHGFSVPSYIWEPTIAGLVEEGYRVLSFDLYGRGYSDRPNIDYNLDLFVQQISELTIHVVPGETFHLVGLSMGGPIVAAFTNQSPEMIKSVTLIAPEVLTVGAKDIFPMNVPLVGEWIVGAYLVPVQLPQSQPEDFFVPENFPGWEERYTDQLQYKGFKNAILSTIRNLVKMEPLTEYEKLNELDIPALLIWGEEDQSVSYEAILKLMQAMPEIETLFVGEAGHIPHYEKPEVVNSKLIEFLKKAQ